MFVRHKAPFEPFVAANNLATIPDNLRSGVSGAHRYEPDLNPTYHDLVRHYRVAVLPARVRRPKVCIPGEVEHGIRVKWNIDSGGSGTSVPEVVNARR